MSTLRRSVARGTATALFVALAACCLVSCEDDSGGEAKDYGEFRLTNKSDTIVELLVGGELRITAGPNQLRGQRTIAPPGLVEVTIRTEAGEVLWSQMADVPDNAFAQYNVQADLTVILSAGNIAKPYEVGSNKEQVRLSNQADFPVEVLMDGEVIGAVAPYYYATYDVRGGVVTIAFRRRGERELFSQTMDVPRNGFFSYTVLPNGRVIATGGEVAPNIQEQPYRYYHGYR